MAGSNHVLLRSIPKRSAESAGRPIRVRRLVAIVHKSAFHRVIGGIAASHAAPGVVLRLPDPQG